MDVGFSMYILYELNYNLSLWHVCKFVLVLIFHVILKDCCSFSREKFMMWDINITVGKRGSISRNESWILLSMYIICIVRYHDSSFIVFYISPIFWCIICFSLGNKLDLQKYYCNYCNLHKPKFFKSFCRRFSSLKPYTYNLIKRTLTLIIVYRLLKTKNFPLFAFCSINNLDL